jgi:hypothetical protein
MKNTLPEFTERELQEIALAQHYVYTTNHGTSGHLAYNVIVKLLNFVHLLQACADTDLLPCEQDEALHQLELIVEKFL